MSHRSISVFLIALCSALPMAILADEEAELPEPADREIDFVKDIQPLFKKHCIKCHSSKKQEAGFRLDSKDLALAGGDSGTCIEPGNSAESLLVRFIGGIDENITMPPEGDLLSKKQVGIVRAWIDQGAKWPESADSKTAKKAHWAYQAVSTNGPPVTSSKWARNGVDAFILPGLAKHKIKPSPEASQRVLIRRLHFDLLGIPPTPEEVSKFVKDESPKAYENLVDRLLASKHFGERWGRHWLDMARYADSDGYEKDRARPNAWRWRDWVINAINQDQPFDQFTIEQLAGDLMPDATAMQRLATAFHRQTLTNTEGGTDQEQFRVEACFDRIETTSTVWLGLTVGCARCHTHKYDQITQREYYQLFAFVNNGDETTTPVPKTEIETAKYKTNLASHQVKLKALEDQLAKSKAQLKPQVEAWVKGLEQSIKTAKKSPAEWHVVKFDDVKIASKSKITLQDDGSYLLTGSPDKDKFTLETDIKFDNITAIKVETIPDKSLPAKGAGRADNGNFVLSHVRSYLAEGRKPTSADVLTFSRATADFSQSKFQPSLAFDPSAKNGWAVSPELTKPHAITLYPLAPLKNAGKGRWQLVLDQQYGGKHTLGRFRVSVRTGGDPRELLPKPVLAAVETPAEKRTPAQLTALTDYVAQQDPVTKKLLTDLDNLKKAAPKEPLMQVRVVTQRTNSPRTTYILSRGEFLNPVKDAAIRPNGLSVLPELKTRNKDKMDRMDLANWLVSSQNPLTPRVAVNHVWAHLFGEGLVRTVNDFGVRGEKPSHPELLDWLAHEFRSSLGWSRKRIIRLIVLSATYRQSSVHRDELADVDPRNFLLARQNRLRSQAETIRDMCLSVSGRLSTKIGGPSVFPPLPPGVAELSYANNFKWVTSKGEDRYRRGMYTFFKRTSPHPNLVTFDCPDANTTCVKRQSSNTPLQALILLNNSVYSDASRGLANRLLAFEADTDAARLNYGFEITVARSISNTESQEFRSLLKTSRDWYKAHPEDAKKLVADSVPKESKTPIEERAAWVATSRMLLNLDEFITRP
jgi:mono/diheme cytochrome c family protein